MLFTKKMYSVIKMLSMSY